MGVRIGKATVHDSEVISRIHASSWRSTYIGMVPQRYLDELRDDFWVPAFKHWLGNNVTALLLYENEVPVGCIAYGKSRDSKFPEYGEIISIYVLPEYCYKGYGQKLLEMAVKDLKNMGYSHCYLWVLKDNRIARQFYEKNGFCPNQDEYHFVIMQKRLIDVRYILNMKED